MNQTILTQGLPADTVFTFSQASLQDYLDCPRRFQLRYIQNIQWPAVEAEPLAQLENHQREALFFHRLAQQHLLGLNQAALAALATSPDLSRWWRNFIAAAPDLAGWQIHTEKALACRIGSHRLICKFDLLAIRDRRAVIYDWKTFARRPRDEWLAVRMQTKVYRAMLMQAGSELNGYHPFAPADISMVYWFAEFPSEPASFDYDDRQHTRDWQRLEGLVREIANAATFPLTDDPNRCRFCTYRSFCDRGLQAGTGPDYEPEATSADSWENEFDQVGEMQP